jgi:dihydroxyacid dehydratase/phosphogluconate dehydratase
MNQSYYSLERINFTKSGMRNAPLYSEGHLVILRGNLRLGATLQTGVLAKYAALVNSASRGAVTTTC